MSTTLDSAFLTKTTFSIHTGGGGVVFGAEGTVTEGTTIGEAAGHSQVAETWQLPKQFEAPGRAGGGISGRTVGGIGKGWKPKPASGAPGFVLSSPRTAPEKALVPSYLVDNAATVSSMSFTQPTWPTNIARRDKADGVHGEFVPKWPLAAEHRSTGGHEAFPADSPRHMLN